MTQEVFKTDLQREREERDLALYRDHEALTAVQGQSKTMVNEHLMRKYNIHSAGTIYTILKRVSQKLQEARA